MAHGLNAHTLKPEAIKTHSFTQKYTWCNFRPTLLTGSSCPPFLLSVTRRERQRDRSNRRERWRRTGTQRRWTIHVSHRRRSPTWRRWCPRKISPSITPVSLPSSSASSASCSGSVNIKVPSFKFSDLLYTCIHTYKTYICASEIWVFAGNLMLCSTS